MNERVINLIRLVHKLECERSPDSKHRDAHYEVCWTYNYGDPYFYIAHDGYQWTIEDVLPPSQNQFNDINKAWEKLYKIMKNQFNAAVLWNEHLNKNAKYQEGDFKTKWSSEELEEFKEKYKEIISE